MVHTAGVHSSRHANHEWVKNACHCVGQSPTGTFWWWSAEKVHPQFFPLRNPLFVADKIHNIAQMPFCCPQRRIVATRVVRKTRKIWKSETPWLPTLQKFGARFHFIPVNDMTTQGCLNFDILGCSCTFFCFHNIPIAWSARVKRESPSDYRRWAATFKRILIGHNFFIDIDFSSIILKHIAEPIFDRDF